MQDKRHRHRSRTRLEGRIAYNDRVSTFDCVVRDLSDAGAKLVFENTACVPNEFELLIRTKGESRRARRVWADRTQAGVEFIAPASRSAPPAERGVGTIRRTPSLLRVRAPTLRRAR